MINHTDSVLSEVKEERSLQNLAWGEQDHNPFYWLAVLVEEVGEVAEALVRGHETTIQDYRHELIQVAAVSIAAIESWDRQQG